MSAGDGDKSRKVAEGPGGAEEARTLIDADDWKDSPGQKTICEYHKEGLPDGVCENKEVDDLDYFSDYWKGHTGGKLQSEYHKEGAPYIEESTEWDGHRPRRDAGPPKKAPAAAQDGGGGPKEKAEETPARPAPPTAAPARPAPVAASPARPAQKTVASARAAPTDEETPKPSGRRALPPLERLIDLPSIELASYAMFRSVIGRGIRIPLRREGLIDMDVIVKDRDIVLNTNRLQFELPSLAIWRLIFAYKGEAVIEYGRGVKNNIKIHRWRLFKLLLQMWWSGRKKASQLEKER